MMLPLSLVSLLDVIKLDAGNTVAAQGSLGSTIGEWRLSVQLIDKSIEPVKISLENRAQILGAIRHLRDVSVALNLVAAQEAANRAFEYLLEGFSKGERYGVTELGHFISHLDRLLFAFSSEMRAKLVFAMPAEHAAYYTDIAHFGTVVEEAFPSVIYDVAEAAKCRSVGRWTACVMHVMRVLEMGLTALASHFGVQADSNWNTILNQIESKAREVNKRTDGKEAEQWAAEAGTHLRFIKNAWRNHAMHPLEKYDEDRAVAIFDNAKSFMQHLALRLAE